MVLPYTRLAITQIFPFNVDEFVAHKAKDNFQRHHLFCYRRVFLHVENYYGLRLNFG